MLPVLLSAQASLACSVTHPVLAHSARSPCVRPPPSVEKGRYRRALNVGNACHNVRMRSSIEDKADTFLDARRRCLVCDFVEEVTESAETDVIGPECSRCHAPTERIEVIAERRIKATREPNPHAAALGRLGGLKGGHARAAVLTPKRRREIARVAARARWNKE
jgi:hypothetical protein